MKNKTTSKDNAASRPIIPVILAGGSGTRLWPMSRALYPKQLLKLGGEQTMLQETIARLAGIPDLAAPLVICNGDHRFMVAEQLREAGLPATIILEPAGRNTAPAVAIAALQGLARGDDALLLVLPADHVIADREAFRQAVVVGAGQARAGRLITFGIVPNRPETGYGYIRRGPSLAAGVFAVSDFVEKPDFETASRYLFSGDYFWNSGMFLFSSAFFLAELERFAPEILAACRLAFNRRTRDLDFIRLDQAAFTACPENSIDYAVMEKTDRAAVLPLDCGWSDVGSWAALWEIGEADSDGNVVSGDVLVSRTANSYINASHRLVAAVGLEGHAVIETADAVLIAPLDQVQDVKEIVRQLREQNREEAVLHRKVYRPWGDYECIDGADCYQAKRITVKPGASLSMQMHHHRAEHWVVVRGTARVTNGSKVMLLSENQSTYIPVGEKHRLENPGQIPLELIEVQSGSYLGEDDIVRFDDVYGRGEEG